MYMFKSNVHLLTTSVVQQADVAAMNINIKHEDISEAL